MKKLSLIMIILINVIFFVGCAADVSAEDLLSEYLASYGVKGTIYSSGKQVHEQGYIGQEVLDKAFVYEGDFPNNFAICLNYRAAVGFEAGVFICDDADEVSAVTEMCEERLDAISNGKDKGIVMRSGKLIFYTTAEDREKAEDLFRKIIRSRY